MNKIYQIMKLSILLLGFTFSSVLPQIINFVESGIFPIPAEMTFTLNPAQQTTDINILLPEAGAGKTVLYTFTPLDGVATLNKTATGAVQPIYFMLQNTNSIGANQGPAGVNLFVLAPGLDLTQPIPRTFTGPGGKLGCFFSPGFYKSADKLIGGLPVSPGQTSLSAKLTKEGTLTIQGDPNALPIPLGCIAGSKVLFKCTPTVAP